jgi:hypothetical protein
MFKANSIVLFASFFMHFTCVAQLKETDPNFEKHYSDLAPIETDEIRIEFIKPHSQEGFTQITLKVFNKTNDYILMKKHAAAFISSENGYGTKFPKEDIDFIEPHGDITRSLKAEGGIGFKVNELKIVLDSVFSKAPVNGKTIGAGEFQMEPDKNSIMMEPFAVTLKKWRYDTRELSADFKIRYRGEGIGIINESKLKIRKADGTILKNTEAKAQIIVVPPMATKTLTVLRPFQKDEVAKKEEIHIMFDEALTESINTPFKVPSLSLTFDLKKTTEANK